jgi:hypothetical protein
MDTWAVTRKEPLLYILGKRPHRFRSYGNAIATGERIYRVVDAGKYLHASAFSVFPQRQRLHHGVFRMLNPASLDGLADKGCLIRGRANFDSAQDRGLRKTVKRPVIQLRRFNIFCGFVPKQMAGIALSNQCFCSLR